MYKLFLTLRYLVRKLIAVFAILSVWLCVAMVLIVFSVMDGFLDNIREHSRGLLSDIVIDNSTLQGFPYYEEFGTYLRTNRPELIERITPVIYNYGIMRVGDTNFTKPVRVVGIKLDEYCEISAFRNSLYYERHFPGLTTLDPSPVPIAGIDARGGPVLPREFVEAFAKFRAAHPQEELPAPSISSPVGVGYFEQLFGEPGYAGTPLPGIIIGTDLIYERRKDGSYNRVLNRGCEIILTVLPLTRHGKLAEDPIPIAMRHVDDSRTRVYEIDNMNVYADFTMLQKMLSMNALERTDGALTAPRTSQLLVRLKEGTDAPLARAEIEAQWGDFLNSMNMGLDIDDIQLLRTVNIETWQERQVQFIAAVEKEKVLVTVLFGIISLVAIVLIGVIFYMVVLQKTRDIGVIKSLGATRGGIAAVFLMYGAVVGVIGGILGVITGSVFVHYINEIQDLLAQMNPQLRVWSPDVYTFDRIPNVVKTPVMINVFLMAVVTSILGATVPAIKAACVWPVNALRYE